MEIKKRRVVIYVRVSTQEQAKEGYSINEQIERLKKYCEAMGWEVVFVYVDPGYSGGNIERPGLQAMIKKIKEGGIDTVVVYKLDRLSRSQLDTLYLIEKVFLANNTDFVSMNENFDTSTPFGRAMIGILAVFAQLEREQIKERMGMGKEARAKEGKWNGGSTTPVGYSYNPNTDLLEIKEYEAMIVKEAFNEVASGTLVKTLEKKFMRKGYKKDDGHMLTAKTLKYILRNKAYIGYLYYQGEYNKAEHEHIIDDETFYKVQKILDIREEAYKERGVSPKATALLTGILFCKNCGARYSKQENSRRKPDKPLVHWYKCYSRHKKTPVLIKDPKCKNKNWKMKELDELIFAEIRKLALDPNYADTVKEEKAKRSDAADKIKILNKRIDDIDEQISRFMDLYGIGKFTIDQVSDKVDPLNDARAKLKDEIEELTAAEGELTIAEAVELASSFDEVLQSEEFEKTRNLIHTLINKIVLDEDDVYIHWNFA